jgi:SAM-dependent methyltransferase
LNLGGGPQFRHLGWLNLDEVTGAGRASSFRFGPECRFPLPDSSIERVYSSHCFEHLDDRTLHQVISETHRVLLPNAKLIIKIPDFDRILQAYRSRDERFLSAETWYLNTIIRTWPRHGIQNLIEYRTAYIFCGFWNEQYGHHFNNRQRQNVDDPGSYNGPPIMTLNQVRQILSEDSPHRISSLLREFVLSREPTISFNHQNAWSRTELTEILCKAGFQCLTFDPGEAIDEFREIPGIELMREISLYCVAQRI